MTQPPAGPAQPGSWPPGQPGYQPPAYQPPGYQPGYQPQPQYPTQPGYGPPGYPPQGPAGYGGPPKKSNTVLILSAALVLVVIAAIIAVVAVARSGSDESPVGQNTRTAQPTDDEPTDDAPTDDAPTDDRTTPKPATSAPRTGSTGGGGGPSLTCAQISANSILATVLPGLKAGGAEPRGVPVPGSAPTPICTGTFADSSQDPAVVAAYPRGDPDAYGLKLTSAGWDESPGSSTRPASYTSDDSDFGIYVLLVDGTLVVVYDDAS